MVKRATCSILICALVIAAAGCAPRRTPYDDLYASLKEEPGEWNKDVLAGRRIVIDPGHGGAFDGALGPDSLSEADVNLGVALHLWGLLEDAGAEVYLIRTTDRDFLAEGQEEVRDDLKARVELANSFDPEVFISIHHNSNLALDRRKNSVEIYYRSGDPGPSLELAREIHLHLARNLGIEETVIKPGSYFVLRNSDAHASVLGEASYLSHPAVEKRLKLSEKQRLEAEAYFLGLLSYFSRGVPRIERIAPAGDTLTNLTTIAFRAHPAAGVPLDPSSARIRIRSRESTAYFDERTGLISYSLDSRMPNGPYALEALIKSVGGATGRCRIPILVINRPPCYILPVHAAAEADSSAYFSIMILDRLGQPIADDNRIIARGMESGIKHVCSTRNGTITFRGAPTGEKQTFIVEAPGLADTVSFTLLDRMATLLAVDSERGTRIPFPTAVSSDASDSSAAIAGDARGNIWIPPSFEGSPFTVYAAGYRPALIGPDGMPEHGLLKLQPLFGGILAGTRIVIDPAGGGSDPGGRGVDESRGASINLDVATRLRDILRRGGAHVLLTRRGEEVVSPRERIYRANGYRADLAISIHHSGEGTGSGCSILHYPGSTGGISLADELAQRLEGLPPCESYATGESADLFLQQTNCPACMIFGGPIEDTSQSAVLVNPRYAQQAAQRITGAILGYIGADRWNGVERTFIIELDGQPVEGGMISIDQVVTSSTDGLGKARFPCIESGMHVISYFMPGEPPISRIRLIDIGTEPSKEILIRFSSGAPAGEP
jgi:N-acetylmuramoyl-L-alanine amidase